MRSICLVLLFVSSVFAADVGPFKWSRKLLGNVPNDSTIGLNGEVENAELLSGGSQFGEITSSQWQGTSKSNTSCTGSNSFVGSVGKNYKISLSDFFIVGRVVQQDAHMRIGFMNCDQSQLNVEHGTFWGFNGVLAYDSVVLELAFRNVSSGDKAWQLGYYSGSPLQLGVWKVAAGKSLSMAQSEKDASGCPNCLGLIPMLVELSPSSKSSFSLRVGVDGFWRVDVDLCDDGCVDYTVNSDQTGNKRHGVVGLGQQSGLIVSTVPAAGNAVGTVGVTNIVFGYSEFSDFSESYDRRPLVINPVFQSFVSPVMLSGERWRSSYSVSVSGNSFSGDCQPNYYGERSFYFNYPLLVDGVTSLTVKQSGYPTTDCYVGTVWSPVDLLSKSGEVFDIGLNQSMLFMISGSGGNVGIDVNGDGVVDYSGVVNQKFVCSFGSVGSHTVVGYVNGVVVGSLVVKVVSVDLDGPIACMVGRRREKGVEIFGDKSLVSFVANDPSLLEVSVKELTPYGARLYLKPLKRGTPILCAVVGGSVVAQQEIDEFEVEYSATDGVVTSELGISNETAIIKPYISDLTLNLNMFAHNATFSGGYSNLSVNTNDFEKVFVVDEYVGVFKYDIEFPENEVSYCHKLSWDQHSKFGTPIDDFGTSINSSRCDIEIPEVIYIINDKDRLSNIVVPKLRSIKTGASHPGLGHVFSVINSAAVSPFSVTSNVDCPMPVGHTNPIDFNGPSITYTYKADAAGYYDVSIGGTTKGFEKKVCVVDVTHKTEAPAPDGTPDNRTIVGDGEYVDITTNPEVTVNWSVDEGELSLISGSSVVFTADRENANVVATFPNGQTYTKKFLVVKPQYVEFTRYSNRVYAIGNAGSGFNSTMRVYPLNVSFKRVKVREGYAEAVTVGYYTKFDKEHKIGNELSIDKDNRILASDGGFSLDIIGTNEPGSAGPFSTGSFTWDIPWEYSANGNAFDEFYTATQSMVMLYGNSGTETTTKAGSSRTRKITGEEVP